MALYCPCNSREKYFSMKDHAFRSVVMAARSRDTSASIALRFKFGFKRRAFALCDDFTEFLSMTHDCSLLILSSQRCVVRRLAPAKSAMASGEASGLRAKAARIAGSLL